MSAPEMPTLGSTQIDPELVEMARALLARHDASDLADMLGINQQEKS